MNQKKFKLYKKIALTALGLASVIIAFGFGCGIRFKSLDNPQKKPEKLGQIIPEPETQTVSLVYANQVLNNMLSVTNVKTPSQETLNFYEDNKANISEFGAADSLNAPMIMTIMGLGAEVCHDLILQEISPANPRNIFNSIDFSLAPGAIDDASLSETVRHMARSFWGRNETPEELDVILQSVREAMSDPKTSLIGPETSLIGPEGTKGLIIYICSGMLTSIDALQL